MPRRLPIACSQCGQPDCAKHRRFDPRPNATQRLYDARWRRVREQKLNESPLCQRCQAEGKVTAATEVHHIVAIRDIPNGGPTKRLELQNLESLCHSHHMAEE